jgi:hypothetical protein
MHFVKLGVEAHRRLKERREAYAEIRIRRATKNQDARILAS